MRDAENGVKDDDDEAVELFFVKNTEQEGEKPSGDVLSRRVYQTERERE